jgi:hypothetical protein
MRVSLALFASVLLLAACSQQDKKPAATAASPAAPPAAGPHAEFIPTQAELDRFRAEGPDPALRKIAVADYWLNYKLMQATGIEKELGGEAQAIEALKALGDAYERRMRGAKDEVPKMIQTAFTGEGMTSGFMGMGMGSFVGLISGGMISSAVSSMSDERLAELSEAGPIPLGNRIGLHELTIAIYSLGPTGTTFTLQETYDRQTQGLMAMAQIVIVLGLVTLFISMAGLYGVVSFTVSRQFREIRGREMASN